MYTKGGSTVVPLATWEMSLPDHIPVFIMYKYSHCTASHCVLVTDEGHRSVTKMFGKDFQHNFPEFVISVSQRA